MDHPGAGAAVAAPPAAPASGPARTGHPHDSALVPRVAGALASFLAERREDAAAIDPAFSEAISALVDFVLCGGKRIRPTFAWWGWRGAGGHPDQEVAPAVLGAVSALELIQACALIHDDLMDGSTTRRQRPTVHVDFADRHRAARWNGRPERFGTAAAVLLGDLAMVWADDMLHTAGLPADAVRRATPAWRAMRTEVLGGQYLDVLYQSQGDLSVAAALRIDRYKTAAYTVERPLQLGAAIAAAAPELTAAYRRFGAAIGVAFQLRDDLLGVFGDPLVTGKPAGDDLREAKPTLLVALALERAQGSGTAAAARLISAALGDEGLDGRRLDEVRSALVDLGAVDGVEKRISELRCDALDALAGVELAPPAARRLTDLADAATNRSA